MLADNKQIDKRTTMRNQNRSAALGRPAMKLLGASTSRKENPQKPTQLSSRLFQRYKWERQKLQMGATKVPWFIQVDSKLRLIKVSRLI